MTKNLLPYPSYRPVGLPWLEQVPAHWQVLRIKDVLREFDQRTSTGEGRLLSLRMREGLIDHIEAGGKRIPPNALVGYKIVEPGTLVMNRMRAASGLFGIAKEEGFVSPDYATFKPTRNTNVPYLVNLFKCPPLARVFRAESKGLGTGESGFLRLYSDRFGAIHIPHPPADEQLSIVRFIGRLDRLTARYLRAKQKLVILLEEQKRAIIFQAVTHGQDQTVRFASSGVEWLGDVPKHWKVLQLRRVASARCDGPFGSGLTSAHYAEHGIRVIRLQNIGSTEFKAADKAYISPLHYASLGDHSVIRGDLLIAGLGDERNPPGRACVAPDDIEPAMVKADCFRFRLDPRQVDPFFVALQLTATAVVASAILSTGATRQRINLTSAAYRAIAFPSLAEQNAIIEYIRKDTAALTAGIKMLHNEISLMREYRARLISDVVRGQLDVREAVSSLPNEDSETDEMLLASDLLEEGDEAGLEIDDLGEEVAE